MYDYMRALQQYFDAFQPFPRMGHGLGQAEKKKINWAKSDEKQKISAGITGFQRILVAEAGLEPTTSGL